MRDAAVVILTRQKLKIIAFIIDDVCVCLAQNWNETYKALKMTTVSLAIQVAYASEQQEQISIEGPTILLPCSKYFMQVP